jgi:hypothetical protein
LESRLMLPVGNENTTRHQHPGTSMISKKRDLMNKTMAKVGVKRMTSKRLPLEDGIKSTMLPTKLLVIREDRRIGGESIKGRLRVRP